MSFLDNVQLAFQCPLRWEKLVGGERERYCSSCEKHVHNLSAMTRGEATRFLREQNAPICIRVEVDAQGRAVHRPGLAAVALAASLAACGTDEDSAFDSGSGAYVADGVAEHETHPPSSGRTHADRADGASVIAEASDTGLLGRIKVTGTTPALPTATHAQPTTQPEPTVMPLMGGIAPSRVVRMGKPVATEKMGQRPYVELLGEPVQVERMGDYAPVPVPK